jgi:hypothetical protein
MVVARTLATIAVTAPLRLPPVPDLVRFVSTETMTQLESAYLSVMKEKVAH